MRLTIAVLSVALMQAQSTDPAALLRQAKGLLQQPGKGKDAMALARTANQRWQALASNDPSYAESLDLYIALAKNLQSESGDLQPMAKRAVDIYEGRPDTPPAAMALALEIEADLLGRTGSGAADWSRAKTLRAQHVEGLYSQNHSLAAGEQTPPIRIGQGISAPVLVSKQEPEYTLPARLIKLAGSVLLAIIIDRNGEPTHIRLVRGCGYGLDEKAAEAVHQWRFQPAIKDGKTVAVMAQIEVNFRLLDNAPGIKRLTAG